MVRFWLYCVSLMESCVLSATSIVPAELLSLFLESHQYKHLQKYVLVLLEKLSGKIRISPYHRLLGCLNFSNSHSLNTSALLVSKQKTKDTSRSNIIPDWDKIM